ncbi:MAG: FixH family protein, partial [Pseudomonadota bacterium]
SSWIPWAFVGFFLVVVAANGIMLSFAISSFNGLSTDGAYDRGLSYNEVLAEEAAQDALGWRLAAGAVPLGDGVIDVQLQAFDEQDRPVMDAVISVLVSRPISDDHDFTIELSHRGEGLYGEQVSVPLEGFWNLRMDITRGDDRLRADARVLVTP